MKQLKRYLLTAICFLSVSGILLTCPASASPSAGVGAPRSLPANGQTAGQRLSPRPTDSAPLVEEFSFLIKDFKIDHQGDANNLNIAVRYRYAIGITNAEYPDFRLIATDIEGLLTNYPNEKDYWEIVNKKITEMVLKKHPSIVEVTSEMQVSPTSLVPYTRSSIITRRRRHQVKQQKAEAAAPTDGRRRLTSAGKVPVG